jgi:hypothetical protein
VLSPEQFIEAGDQLTNFGWKWQKSLNKSNKLLSDPNKQYLMALASSRVRLSQIAAQNIEQSSSKDEYGFVQVTGDDRAVE